MKLSKIFLFFFFRVKKIQRSHLVCLILGNSPINEKCEILGLLEAWSEISGRAEANGTSASDFKGAGFGSAEVECL